MVALNTATALAILAFTDRALAAPTKRQDHVSSFPTMPKMNSEFLIGKRQEANDDQSFWAKRGDPLTTELLIGKRQDAAGQWAPTVTDKRASFDEVAYNGNIGKRQLDEVTQVLDDPAVNRRQAQLIPYIIDEEKRQTSNVVNDLLDSLSEKRRKREDQLADLSPEELSANNNFQLYQKRQTWSTVNDLLDDLSEKRQLRPGQGTTSVPADNQKRQHSDFVNGWDESVLGKREDQLANLTPEELAANANFQIYQKRGLYDVNTPVLSIADQKKRSWMDGMVESSEGADDVLPLKKRSWMDGMVKSSEGADEALPLKKRSWMDGMVESSEGADDVLP